MLTVLSTVIDYTKESLSSAITPRSVDVCLDTTGQAMAFLSLMVPSTKPHHLYFHNTIGRTAPGSGSPSAIRPPTASVVGSRFPQRDGCGQASTGKAVESELFVLLSECECGGPGGAERVRGRREAEASGGDCSEVERYGEDEEGV